MQLCWIVAQSAIVVVAERTEISVRQSRRPFFGFVPASSKVQVEDACNIVQDDLCDFACLCPPHAWSLLFLEPSSDRKTTP